MWRNDHEQSKWNAQAFGKKHSARRSREPCVLTFLVKNFKEGNIRIKPEAILSLALLEFKVVSETNEGRLGAEDMAELRSDISMVDGKIKLSQQTNAL